MLDKSQGKDLSKPSNPLTPGPRCPVLRGLSRSLVNYKEGSLTITSGRMEEIIDVPPTGIDTGIERIIDKLADAKERIMIAAYIFDQKSEIGIKLLKALEAKQKQNPNFKVYITSNKPREGSKKAFIKELNNYNLKAEVSLHPVKIIRSSLHTKLYVIDSDIVYTGGDNIDNPMEADVLVGFSGDAVAHSISQFEKDFNQGKIYRVANHQATETGQAIELEYDTKKRTSPPKDGTIALGILDKNASMSWKGSSEINLGNQAIKYLFKFASKKISIITPNFNDISVWKDLLKCVKKGIEIEILLPKNKNNLASLVDSASNRAIVATQNRLPEELKSLIKIRWYADSTGNLLINHSKAIFIDGHSAYIGSHNLDNQSMSFSAEWGFIIENRNAVCRLKSTIFQEKWEHSIPATTPLWLKKLPQPGTSFTNRVLRISMSLALLIDIALDSKKRD